MAIVPQGNLGINRSAGSVNEGEHHDVHEVAAVEREVNRVLKGIYESTYAALSELDPSDCIDGNCPTVEIPIIICMNNITSRAKTDLGIKANSTLYPIPVFARIAETIENTNQLLATGRVVGKAASSLGAIRTDENYPTSHSTSYAGVDQSYVNFLDFGYYTGSRVFNEEKQELEDEFVSFRTLRELYPNIKFIFPTRIRTEFLLNAFSEKFNIKDLYSDVLNKELPEQFKNTFIYFPEDTPGLLEVDLSIFNEQYFNKLDYVSSIILSKDPGEDVGLYSARFKDHITNKNITVPGSSYKFNFPSLAYVLNTYFAYTSLASADNIGGAYTTSVTKFYWSDYKSASTHLHEFFHGAANAGHSWYVPQICGFEPDGFHQFNFGTGLRATTLQDSKYSTGIVFPYLGTYAGSAEFDGDLFNNNILDHPLKPPFAYNVLNPDYSRIKRDADNAAADHQEFEDKIADGEIETAHMYQNSAVRVYNLRQELVDRKNLLNTKLQNTPEYISGDYYTIEGEEKEFVEFYIKRYIKHITNNFTSKYTLLEGVGITPKIIPPETEREDEAIQVYTGIQSFWGGSCVLNNPPDIDSEYVDPVNGVAYKVINIKEQRYATIIKPISDSVNISEASNILASQSDPLWRFPTQEELTPIGYKYEATYGGSMSVNFKNGLGIDFYPSALFVEPTEEHSVRRVFLAGRNSVSEMNIEETNSEGNQAHLFMVKDIDLLQEDSISTSFVVNPTNDDGTRKGPDVTSYIPFCKIEDDEEGNPKPTDAYDVTWAFNYNSYNPDYPPYPDNTKITDLFNEEHCPCLYKQQSYVDENGIVQTYTIIKEGSSFTALRNLIDGISNNSRDNINKYKSFLKAFNMFIENKYNNNYIIPDTFTRVTDARRIPNPLLYRYSDPNNPYLEIVPSVGYYGFGYATILPIEFNINPFSAFLEKMNSVDQEVFENSPLNAYFSPSPYAGSLTRVYFPSTLRLGTAVQGLGFLKSSAYTLGRYRIGSSDAANDIYNPLTPYEAEVYAAKDSNSAREKALKIPTEDYYSDFSGNYNPLNLSDVMQYGHNEGVLANNCIPPHMVRGTNYLFNSNSYIATAYRTIAKDSKGSVSTLPDIVQGNTIKLAGEGYLISRVYPLGEGNFKVICININRYIQGNLREIYHADPEIGQNLDDYDIQSEAVSFEEAYTFGNGDYNAGLYVSVQDQMHAIRESGLYDVFEFTTKQLVSDIYVRPRADNTGLISIRFKNKYSGIIKDAVGVLPYSKNKLAVVTDNIGDLLIEDNDSPLTALGNSGSLYNNKAALIFRTFTISQAEIDEGNEIYYVKDAFETVGKDISDFNIEGEFPGCTDANALNFNPEATFDNGTCEEKVFGCTQAWADNFNANANVDNNSCTAILCLDAQATGSWGFGYNPTLIEQVTSYSPGAIIPAEGSPVLEMDESKGFEICQFLLEKRAAIMKVVCLNMSEELNSFVCNDNEVVKVIKDIDTNSISSYSSNPTVVDVNLKDLIEEVVVIGIKSTGDKININVYPFADGVSQYDIDANRDYVDVHTEKNRHLALIEHEVFLYEGSANSAWSGIGHLFNKHIKYNCVENPILPDGSGGCLLYSFEAQQGPADYRLQGCVVPEVRSKTPEDCFNETLFEGGYISDADLFSQEVSFTEGTCEGNESKYIIPHNMKGYQPSGANSDIILSVTTKDLLPLYSEYQVASQTGYPTSILRNSQLPADIEGSLIEDSEEYSVSQVLQLVNPNFLFTEDGVSYTGPYKYSIVNGSKVYYIHEEGNPYSEGGASPLKGLFSRNELLERGIANSEIELTANNFFEIVNEINNLTIFTDN